MRKKKYLSPGVMLLSRPWRYLTLPGLIAVCLACQKPNDTSNADTPFLEISNGQFEIHAVILNPDGTTPGNAMGSGTLTFDYSGDSSGSFFASGALLNNQTEHAAVGALLDKIPDEDYGGNNEGLSIMGFRPVADGKADIFILGTKTDVELDSIKAGHNYGIGPLDRFNGVYFQGLSIPAFWAGRENLLEVAERSYILTSGIIVFTFRDSTHFRGTFSGRTDGEPGAATVLSPLN